MKPIKPVKMWGVANIETGVIYPYSIGSSRASAISGFCSNDPYPPDVWKAWRKRGWRAIRVVISPMTDGPEGG